MEFLFNNYLAPNGPPFNVRAYILNETSIKVNWTISSQANGYVIVYIDSTGNRNVLSTTKSESVINNLPLSTYNISVYSYKDVPSVNSTHTLLRFDSESTCNISHYFCFINCLVPSPVTSLSVTNISTTDITVNWISIEDGNYVTYYNIYYTPSCPELPSVNVVVFVVPYTTTYSYTLRELYSGMNYTITVRAGNILGASNPMSIIVNETKSVSGNQH